MSPALTARTRDGGVSSQQLGMGTVIEHRAFGERAAEALEAARTEVLRLERTLSRFIATSDVSELNRRAGDDGAVAVSPDTFDLLALARGYGAVTGGLLDVTVAPVVDLWRAASRAGTCPPPSAVMAASTLVDHRDVLLDFGDRSARLRRVGQAVDLGGIGKGYTADRVLDRYRRYGLSSALINLGGNVAALGTRPDGTPWRVGVRHPRPPGTQDGLLGVIEVRDASVVTSGDYQRCFVDEGGHRRHHLIDPRTGYPAESGVTSVTIMAPTSTEADALATIVFVAGLGPGLELVHARSDVEAVVVTADLGVHATAGLVGRFHPAGPCRVTWCP